MEFIQRWMAEPWILSSAIMLPIILLILWKLLRRPRYDEIQLSDKDLYSYQYFDDSPIFENNELVDASVAGVSVDAGTAPPALTEKTADNFSDDFSDDLDPAFSDWEQLRAAENQAPVESPKPPPPSSPVSAKKTAAVKKELPKELIIAINIRAIRDVGFQGTDIFAAMEQLGIQHGKMNIFHHYGIEKAPTTDAVFSIANLLKPGTFNPSDMESFSTPGLIAFMQLPGALGGRVAFELMLHYTQRLATILHGRLEDDRKQPVDAELIDFIRHSIDEFEQPVHFD